MNQRETVITLGARNYRDLVSPCQGPRQALAGVAHRALSGRGSAADRAGGAALVEACENIPIG